MAISLDFTGLLRFSAFWVARRGGESGRRLHLFLYMFFAVCGVVVGNVSSYTLSVLYSASNICSIGSSHLVRHRVPGVLHQSDRVRIPRSTSIL